MLGFMLILSSMKYKLSIVVPVFNASAYIDSCVSCMFAQGFSADEFELIFVDDGSSDDSAEQCEAYVAKYPNVSLYKQNHLGAGAARNAGIDEAEGEYLYFFDVDDSLDASSLSDFVKRCDADNLDMLFFAADIVYENDSIQQSNPQDGKYFERREASGVRSGAKFLVQQQDEVNFCAQPCMFVSRTSFLRESGVRFPSLIANEDNLFVLKATLRAKRVDVDSSKVYHYLVRCGSTTTSVAKNFTRFEAHYYLIREFYREYLVAIDAGQTDVAHAIAGIMAWFTDITLETLRECGEPGNLTFVDDDVSHIMYEKLFLRIHALECGAESLRASESKLQDEVALLQAKVDELEESTTWKVGRALTALPRKIKDTRHAD